MSGLEIVCLEPSHDGRRVIIRRFDFFGGGWVEVLRPGRNPRLSPPVRLPAPVRAAGQTLDKDSRPNVDRMGLNGETVDRVRYRLECNLCGLTVEAREEVLVTKFDKLRDILPETGYLAIPLRVLSATL